MSEDLRRGLEQIEQLMRPTPVQHLVEDHMDLSVKLELLNPFGSSKDRAAYWILRGALGRGELTPETTVVESSSGNFALAMASMCRMLRLQFIPVLDPNCTAATMAFLQQSCKRVEVVRERDASGGFLGTRLRRVRELRAELGQVFWPNQYGNPDAVRGHYHLTGRELVEQVDGLDFVFLGAGTGGTMCGVSHRVKETFPGAQVIAVDTAGSAIFDQPPAPRHIPGLGSTVRGPFFDEADIDDVVIVQEFDTARACSSLLRSDGLYAGGSTGTVYHAIEHYFDGKVRRRPKVAFIAADRGTAYGSTVYDPRWVQSTLLPTFQPHPRVA